MISFDVLDKVAVITLNRPEKRNAFNRELAVQLREYFVEAARLDDVAGVLLRAEGSAFCAGADLAYLQNLQDYSMDENLEDSQIISTMYSAVYELPKPVVCAVQGPALAGGAGLAAVCDWVFAAPEATFGFTEVRIGFIPAIVSYFLIRRLGRAHAAPLLLSGRIISSTEARQLGLVYGVCDKEQLTETCLDFLHKLFREVSPQAFSITKKMIDKLPLMPLHEALQEAARLNAEARMTEDCKRGIAAFLSKTPIIWQ